MTTFRNQHSAHVSAYRAAQAAAQQERAARELATVAAIYAAKRSDYNRFQLCNAIIDLIDDGDALAEREVLMDELGIDEDGNPVPPEGDLCAMPSGYALRAALNPISCNGGL